MDRTKRYVYNKYFFEVIDTEEKAYWLGFIYADGYHNEKYHSIKITLKTSDYEHLLKFNKAIDGNLTLKIDNKGAGCKIIVTCKKMSEDILDKGVMQCKSNKIIFPNFISKELMPHFIRGYFDGDGCIPIHRRKETHIEYAGIKIECNDIFGDKMSEFFIENNLATKVRKEKKKN